MKVFEEMGNAGNALGQDVRYAFRGLRKNPGFTIVAVVMLALGIGSTTAVFSLLHSILWKPLPFPEPHRLVRLFETRPSRGIDKTVVAPGEFTAWRARSHSFAGFAAVSYPGYTLFSRGESHQIDGLKASANLLSILGARPQAGRFFTAEEGRFGAERVAVIGAGLWKTRFHADPGIVGRTIVLDDRPATVVGVLPDGFAFYGPVDVVTPLAFDAAESGNFHHHYLDVFGRLAPGASLRAAQAELSGIAAALERENTASIGDGVGLSELRTDMTGSAAGSLRIAFGAICFVLLIACANLANLLLARAARRRKEIAIRLAIGARRFRLLRQLLTESLVLSLIGGTLGIAAARAVLRIAVASMNGLPRIGEIGLHPAAVVFAAGLALVTGLAFGIVPALQVSRVDPREGLSAAGPGGPGPGGARRARKIFVVAEVALSLVLLLSGGLLLRTFWNLERVDPGFEPARLASVSIDASELRHPDMPSAAVFLERAAESLAALPGAESAAVVNILPLSGNDSGAGITFEGDAGSPGDPPHAEFRAVGGSYFRALGIPIRRGREFGPGDRAGSLPVVIVNRAFADRYWSGQDPIGRKIQVGQRRPENPWRTVVGISGDVRQTSLDTPAIPEVEMPLSQWPVRRAALVVRARRSPDSLLPSIRARLRSIDPTLPTDDLDVYPHLVSLSLASRQWLAQAVAIFAGAAFLLAAIGIYGVIAYRVSERTREIGIRMALGARRGDVVGLIVGEGARVVAAGLLAGLAASAVATRLLANALFGLRPGDPATFAAVTALLFVTGLAASYLPARRAARIDPTKALREE